MNQCMTDLERKLARARHNSDVAFRAMRRAGRAARRMGEKSCLPSMERYAEARAEEAAAYDAVRAERAALIEAAGI